jgi:hypothetical protein
MRFFIMCFILVTVTFGLVAYQKSVTAYQALVAERNAQLQSIILSEVSK